MTPNPFIVSGELSPALSEETDTEPLSIVMRVLSLSYNAAYTEANEISSVELFTIVPVIVSSKSPCLYLWSVILRYCC